MLIVNHVPWRHYESVSKLEDVRKLAVEEAFLKVKTAYEAFYKIKPVKFLKVKPVKLLAEWCECGDKETFHSYPADGECSCGEYKHHVHCGTCGRISQTG